MAIPLSYNLRNLWTRRLTTLLTISGMALVVFVFASMLMLAEGLRKTLVDTGSFDNVVVTRKGSTSEVMSGVDRSKSFPDCISQFIRHGMDRRFILSFHHDPDKGLGPRISNQNPSLVSQLFLDR